MSSPVPHFIGGSEVLSRSGQTFETIEPATGKVLAEVAFGSEQDVDDAVQSAATAFAQGTWRNLAPAERARRLRAMSARREQSWSERSYAMPFTD